MQANRTFSSSFSESSSADREFTGTARRARGPVFAAAFAALLCFGAAEALYAQSSSPYAAREWERDWTVLAMAPDGAWGVATDAGVMEAVARAVGNCQAMSGRTLGCGAYLTTIRAGWSLGLRCGDANIVIAEFDLRDAEFTADLREYEMRRRLYPDMPPCVRAVTVDPSGEIVKPGTAEPNMVLPSP